MMAGLAFRQMLAPLRLVSLSLLSLTEISNAELVKCYHPDGSEGSEDMPCNDAATNAGCFTIEDNAFS